MINSTLVSFEADGKIVHAGWWFGTFFPYIGNNHPNWLSYFSEGFKPPTSMLHAWAASVNSVLTTFITGIQYPMDLMGRARWWLILSRSVLFYQPWGTEWPPQMISSFILTIEYLISTINIHRSAGKPSGQHPSKPIFGAPWVPKKQLGAAGTAGTRPTHYPKLWEENRNWNPVDDIPKEIYSHQYYMVYPSHMFLCFISWWEYSYIYIYYVYIYILCIYILCIYIYICIYCSICQIFDLQFGGSKNTARFPSNVGLCWASRRQALAEEQPAAAWRDLSNKMGDEGDMGGSNMGGIPKSMVYKGKSDKNGWFRGSPTSGNHHMSPAKPLGLNQLNDP